MATATAVEVEIATEIQINDTAPEANDIDINGDAIQTQVVYLIKDPKHEDEKPYELQYDTEGIIPNTNMANESQPVVIHNFRPLQNPQNFQEYGFSVATIDCPLTSIEFDDEEKVKEMYYPEIEKLVWQMFPDAAEVKILEHGLRKRHPQFPALKGEQLEFVQPAKAVHIDFSPDSAARTAHAAFKIAPNQYRRLLTLNFWKSLQGPGNDWPLALCDWRTIDYSSESIAADVVFSNRFTENQRVHYSSKHEWYYFQDLADDEVMIIRQTDSDLEGGGGVAHTSFYNPRADENAAPRASIELRAFVFFS